MQKNINGIPTADQRPEAAQAWLLTAILLAVGLRLAWAAYTRYVEEDAFITFRYARQIAAGHGFVYNEGQKVYGTTTPLLTLLLVPWFWSSLDVVLGARLLDLLAVVGSLLLVWKALRLPDLSPAARLFPIAVLALSPKLFVVDMQGMETPLAILFMAAAWAAWAQRTPAWAGVWLGLLLWTRPDLFLWPLTLFLFELPSSRRSAFRMMALAGLTYLPWLVFATLYFGSPVPHTVIAKWVAYVQFNRAPLSEHLAIILNYLSAADVPRGVPYVAGVLAGLTLGVSAWLSLRLYRVRVIAVLPVFALLEIARLTLTRTTFFTRYFVPALWALLILSGLGLAAIWDQIRERRALKIGYAAVLFMLLALTAVLGVERAREYGAKQLYRQEMSLKAIGEWLNENSPAGATILLEPLGYIGYYSGRVMIDEVGLVTPSVVELKRRRVDPRLYFSIFLPDYYVLHCDDGLRLQVAAQNQSFTRRYQLVKAFDPLHYDPNRPDPASNESVQARNSCYEIWQRIGPQ